VINRKRAPTGVFEERQLMGICCLFFFTLKKMIFVNSILAILDNGGK